MPTLYHRAAPDKLLIIRGLDANPVYLLLYVGPKIEEILYSLRNSAVLLSELGAFEICCTKVTWDEAPNQRSTLPLQAG